MEKQIQKKIQKHQQQPKKFDFVVAALIFGGLTCIGIQTVHSMRQLKTAESQAKSKTVTILNKLKIEKDSLNEVVKDCKDNVDYSIENRAIYQKGYKTYDDMDSLYLLSKKLYINMNKNYSDAEQEFEKKLAEIGKRFCNKNGKYVFTHTDLTGKTVRTLWAPVDISDWLIVLEENKDKIPNYKQIQYENAIMEEIAGTLYSFSEFLNSDFKQYVKTSSAEKNKDKKTLAVSFYGTNQMNTLDNIKQDKILNALINEYMNKFIIFDQNKQLLDKDLYANVMQIALSIKKYNEIESDVVACKEKYTKAVQALDSVKHEIKETGRGR